MGLLDEAIKEHLELKRQRGADPHEVALLQHEAFGGEADDAEHPRPGHEDRAATNVSEETMEIDMSALLGADEEISAERLEEREIEAQDARVGGEEHDEFAWEAPARSAGTPRQFKDRHLESQNRPADESQPASWM